MEELKARRVVDRLRERGTNASLARVGVHQFGVMITLPDGREATWDSDGTATLVAQSHTPWDPPPLGTAFALDGENPEIRYHLVQALVKIGDNDRAKAELDTLLRSNKPFPQLGEARSLAARLGR